MGRTPRKQVEDAARAIRLAGDDRVSDEQRLKDIQAQRLELLRAQTVYKSQHQLEFWRPHKRQAEFIRAILDPEKHTFSALGGNRSGKTAVVMALTVAFAHGRLPWIPVPKPFTLPPPLSIRVLSTGEVVVRFPDAAYRAICAAWESQHLDVDGTPRADVPLPGSWKEGEEVEGTFIPGGVRTQGSLDYLRARLAAPTDPGQLRFKGPVKIRVFGEKSDTLSEVQTPYLKRFIAPEWLAGTKKGQTGVVEFYQFNNGSTINLLTYQQEPASMEGWDGHVCVFDEPPPRPVYIANVRGLVDHKGISVFAMTPLKEPWIADEIANNPDPAYFSMVMSSHENPHVDRGALDAFFSKLSEEELETRRDGKFLHLQGLVFKEFDKQVHVVRQFKPDREYTVYVAIDNHPRTEQAVLFVAIDRHDRVFAFKEIFQHGTPEDIGRWIVEFHDDVHPIEQVLIDRSSQGDTNRGSSTYEIIEARLTRAGIPLDFGSKDLSSGIQLVRDYLCSQNGIASLFITEDCKRLIWELQRYRWQEWRGGVDKSTRTPANKPVDADDHLIEDLRRLIQLPARWVDPLHRARLSQRAAWAPADPVAGY